MCIIWKWLDLLNSPQQIKFVHVGNNAENVLIQISENAFLEPDESWLSAFVQNNIQTEDQVFFFVHKDKLKLESPAIRSLMELCQAITPCQFFEFGGGEDYLYYHSATQKGLLNQVGAIQGNLPADIGSVLDSDPATGIKAVNSEFFLAVWEHYESLLLKKKIYDMRHDVLTDMFTGAFKASSIHAWALHHAKYQSAFFMNQTASERVLPQRKTQDSAFMDAYTAFQSVLHQKNPDAHSFRAITANLLQQIAGLI